MKHNAVKHGRTRTGLLRLSLFIASAFYIIGLIGLCTFFVATKKYATQVALLIWGVSVHGGPGVLEGAGEELFPTGV